MICEEGEKRSLYYNTLTGFVCETSLVDEDECEWIMNADQVFVGSDNPYYIAWHSLNNPEEMTYILQSIGCLDAADNFYECTLDVKKSGDGYLIKVKVKKDDTIQYPITFISSFEHYVSKAIIDSATISKEDFNSYLKSYCVLGNHNKYGEGELNIRFSTSSLPEMKAEDIKSVKLKIRNLFNLGGEIKAYYVDEEWCSWALVNSNKPKKGKFISKGSSDKNGYFNIDITELYRNNLNRFDNIITKQGIRIVCDQGYIVIPTADNSLYPLMLEIEYVSKE